MNCPVARRILGLTMISALLVAPAMAQQKIGFVNTLQILSESEEGKGKISEWEAFFNAKKQEIDTESGDLRTLQQQFTEQQLSLAPETRAQMQRSIEEKTTRIKRLQEDANRESQARRNQIIQDISAKIRAILSEYGKQNGFAVIFLRDPDQQLFVSDSLDVTQEILQIYNQRHPGGGK